jgi:isohexenylglutaconyl-CoA hydratase
VLHTLTHNGVLFVTLNNPAVRNALNDAMLAGMRDALERVAADRSIRALVLRGAGGTFCAGGDFGHFKALMATAPAEPDPIAVSNRAFGAVLEWLAACEAPLVALVEGAAMGGGFGLAAVCDLVLATRDARFAMPELTLGLPPAQIAPFVAARLGAASALRLMLTGARLTADEGKALGLVDEVAPDAAALRACAQRWLGEIGRAEPGAVRATKRILASARRTSLGETLDHAAYEFAASLRSGTAAEGIAALTARRAAGWSTDFSDWPDLP